MPQVKFLGFIQGNRDSNLLSCIFIGKGNVLEDAFKSNNRNFIDTSRNWTS